MTYNLEPKQEHGTGYIPTPMHKFASGLSKYGQPVQKAVAADRSKSVSLAAPIRLMQNWVGCCVGATYALGMSVLDAQLAATDRMNFHNRSMMDIWVRAKQMAGSRGNVGVQMDQGGDAVMVGAAAENDLPVPPSGANDLLDPDVSRLARIDNVLSHRLVNPQVLVDGCIAALQEGKPVAIGMGLATVEYYRAGDQNGVIQRRGNNPDFYHAELLTDYDAKTGLLICTGSWLDWLPPQIDLASSYMDRTKVAFTLDAFLQCVFEARVVDREAVVKPQPTPDGFYTFTPQVWQPPVSNGQPFRIQSFPTFSTQLPAGESAWTATAVQNPDGEMVYPSVFQDVQTG